MPSIWQSVDSDFPTFTGKETPAQQIQAIPNYLYRMKEQLQYTLSNLSEENWNSDALESLTDDAKTELSGKLQVMGKQVADLRAQFGTLSASVSDIRNFAARLEGLEDVNAGERLDALDGENGRVKALEDRADALDGENGRVKALEDRADALDGENGRVKDLEDRADALDGADGRVKVLEDINAGKRLDALDGENGAVPGLSNRVGVLELVLQDVPGRVESLESAVAVDVDGNATIGAEGKQLRLVGEIYVNGVLLTISDSGGDSGGTEAGGEDPGTGEGEVTDEIT